MKAALMLSLLALFIVPAQAQQSLNFAARPDLDARVHDFFASEAARSVAFSAPAHQEIPFDVVFLHVCSLSWDDVHAVGLDENPLWRRFDYLFTRFNSASTYSGPAVRRIFRSTCGQGTHSDLYDPVPEKCQLMSGFKKAGFKPALAMNHDGQYGDFLQTIQQQGAMNVPLMSQANLTVAQHAFDDSPVYDDLAVLNRWLEGRQFDDSPRVALYYNTISLHEGNHLPRGERLSTADSYRIRLEKLLAQIGQFMDAVDYSGRRAVVVMIPEHGGAVRGDRVQAAGARDIPSPALTIVPVGIKVVGRAVARKGASLLISDPVSFLAVNSLIAKMLEKSPYAPGGFSPADYAADLPSTAFVPENQKMLLLRQENRYFLRKNGEGWSEYDATPP